jgi:hypothetical protein
MVVTNASYRRGPAGCADTGATDDSVILRADEAAIQTQPFRFHD